ncbi:MAG: acyltransferase family protein [Bacilli bacterium]|nr:acyltransferase family protein [Bacilli bacterium]
MKKEVRLSNFELMRIISMFFIVFFHMIISTGGNLLNHTTGILHIVLEFISMIIIVHVNSFVLLSGYFQYNKKFSSKKFFHLVFMVWIYEIVLALIFGLTQLHEFSLVNIIKIISPLEFNNLWYFKVYMALYLISPYINILIKNLDQKEHRKLLILLFLMFSIVPTITNQNTFSNTGFTLIQFIFLYIFGSYLRKYPISLNTHFLNYSNKKKFIIFASIFVFLGSFNFLILQFCNNILTITTNEFIVYVADAILRNLYYYQNPILIVQSISYFLMFETLNIKIRVINKISSGIFAVYVITENPNMVKELYKFLKVDTGEMVYDKIILVKILVYSAILVLLCVIIELIRKNISKLIKNILIRLKITNI